MKKIISTLAFGLLTACTNINKEELKKEIKENLKNEMDDTIPKVVKGDGSVFYNEPHTIYDRVYYTHHSTLKCPFIKGGVQRGYTYNNFFQNLYCPVCMDDNLISLFERMYKK